MQDFEELFLRLGQGGGPPEATLTGLVASLLVAFALGQLVAWTYVWTHSGISYSRGFAQAIVLLMIVATLVMYVIGNSVVAAFGLIGALAIIRFRNVLKDTRDTVYVFLSLVLGMAIGSQRISVALVGGLFLLLVAGWLHVVSFGSRGRFHGHLSYSLPGTGGAARATLTAVLDRHCRRRKQVTVHDAGDLVEMVEEVRLRDRRRGHDMVQELRAMEGIGDVTLVLRDLHAEL